MRIQHNVFEDNELHHYGIPGMRWGVRKARGGLGSIFRRKKKKVTIEPSNKKKKKNREVNDLEKEKQYINEYKHRDQMTTRQMQARVNRMKVEKEFKRLAYEDQIARNKAEAEAKAIKRKRRAILVSAALDAVSKMPLEEKVKLDRSLFKSDKEHQEAEDGIRELVKFSKSVAPVASKFIRDNAGIAEKEDKMKQTSLHNVYIPGQTNNELHHYGVPGMRWGARKAVRSYIQARRNTADIRAEVKEQKRTMQRARADFGRAQYEYRRAKSYGAGRREGRGIIGGTVSAIRDRHIVAGAKFNMKDKKQIFKQEKKNFKNKKRQYKLARKQAYKKLMSEGV